MPDDQTKEASHIRILPPQLANQIAAGEVVERPASVVKELLENCIDAKADAIHIEIDQGGHKRIMIRDTGVGIAKEELALALSRHATSKIRDIDDLECISSMGFRGEALASISSVSRLTLSSKPKAQEAAWQASAEGMEQAVCIRPAAHPDGTSIEVLDLFFNTPARRKFLRAQKTEFQHIEQIVKRLALSHPDIAFSFRHNGKSVLKFAKVSLDARVKAVCGQSVFQSMTRLDYAYNGNSISGWCSRVGEGFANNNQQYLFVNRRMIRDKLVLHAIRQAYEGMLPDNLHPAYVLFLDLPAQDMDINVHPSKHEVRFHHARQVHDLIFQALSEALISSEQSIEASQNNNSSGQRIKQSVNHHYIQPLQTAERPPADTDVQTKLSDEKQNTIAEHDTPLGLDGGGQVSEKNWLASDNETAASESTLKPSVASTRAQSVGSRAPSSGASRAKPMGAFSHQTNRHSTEVAAGAGASYQDLMRPKVHDDDSHQDDSSMQGFSDTQAPSYLLVGDMLVFQTEDSISLLKLSSIIAQHYHSLMKLSKVSQPLLMPVSLSLDAHANVAHIDALEAFGCHILRKHGKCILKQVPSVLRHLPWAKLFPQMMLVNEPSLTQGNQSISAEQCLERIAGAYLQQLSVDRPWVNHLLSQISQQDMQALVRHKAKLIPAEQLCKVFSESA